VDTEHLREHIKENYMHGSLIVNALRFCGYRDQGIRFILQTNALMAAMPSISTVSSSLGVE
jgi:hypothetical protein